MSRRFSEHLKSDERILGDSDFVEYVLREATEHLDDNQCREAGLSVDEFARIVAHE